ncbi:SPOR domain-containing protein [candidate division KSB1 bacterium]|nr:SPOR domain-containing protein [candidate division KSB1 bacterium]
MKKLWIAACALLVACAGQQAVQNAAIVQPPEQTPEQASEMVEDFDPLSLPDYKFVIDSTGQETKKPVSVDEILQKKTGDEQVSGPDKVSGFRIQIFSSRDEKEALLERREALMLFSVNVYIEYDNPLWKVRLGDCVTRFEANELLEKVRDRGYRDAWVVRTRVQAPTAEF